VAKSGEELPLSEVVEDMTLVHDRFSDDNGYPISAICRRRIMNQPSLISDLRTDTDHIWTFRFWQHVLDLSTFQLNMTIKRFNLLYHLDGQPLAIMARHLDGRFLWNFEIWHRDLLNN